MSDNRKYRKFTSKQKVVELVLASFRGDRSIAELCREHDVAESLLRKWREQAQAAASERFESGTRELAGTGQVVVAQVHSHPDLAFHSSIDDAEAIPRRVGAYSLVVPDFGTRGHLLDGAALFQLDSGGRWVPAPAATFDLPQTFEPAAPAAAATRCSLWRRLTDTLKSFGRSRI